VRAPAARRDSLAPAPTGSLERGDMVCPLFQSATS
jgi:hypothetical protein